MTRKVSVTDYSMRGLEHRSPLEQATTNLENAIRVAGMMPRCESELCPHPVDVVLSEIRNALRYLEAHKKRESEH